MQFTDYHARLFARELRQRHAPDVIEKLAGTVAAAQVQLNPHQVEAALFAFQSPLSKGALLADEVGLGKTIEAGLVISQRWAERKRNILVIAPADVREQPGRLHCAQGLRHFRAGYRHGVLHVRAPARVSVRTPVRTPRRVPGRAGRALPVTCCMVMALAACGERNAPAARAQFPAPRTGAVQVGGENVTSRDAAIGRVVAARFTQSGEHIVVLDFAPPYVKVFRRNGTLDRAFLAAGGGPLEMRYPASLAVAGDSAILVADGTRRVAVFGMDGQLRGEGRTNFPVLAAVAGCDGEWLAYGPSRRAGDSPSWLHRLHVGTGTAQVVDVDFRDALGEGVIGHGLSYGIARSGDSVRVWHVLTEKPSVLGVACGQNRPDVWAVAPLTRRRAKAEHRKGAVRMSVEPGLRTLAGMAAVHGGVVLAAQVIPEPGDSATTELTLVTAQGERTVSVPGTYTLRDSHPRMGVLVSVTDPVPQLFTISSDELRRLFEGP